MPDKLRIALHQMCSDIAPVRNLDAMVDGIKAAAQGGARFYFAPEMALLLDSDRKRAAASVVKEASNSQLLRLMQVAKEEDIWLHIGSVPLLAASAAGKFVNRSLLVDSQGEIAARYDKMHLFDVALSDGESWQESKQYVAGEEPVLAETPAGKMGLTICYDLRFSGLFSALAGAGAEIFAVPSAFTVPTGKAHWHSLLRARAIESAAFVVAAAQSGQHADGRKTYGHSLVVDPWGEILLDMGEGEGLGFAEIDRARVMEARQQIPVHLNRRPIGSVRRFPGRNGE